MSQSTVFSDDLPEDARELLSLAEQEIDLAEAQAQTAIAQIRAQAEAAMENLRQQAEQRTRAIRDQADQEIARRTGELAEALRPLQVRYAREGMLDEALAIREQVRRLRTRLLNAQPDPGTLSEFGPADAGSERIYEVIGSTDGTVWGTDVYTSDSRLAVAAVHAGLVRAGERGVVRATLLDGLNVAFLGSDRNGVRSHDYGAYLVAYRLARP